MTDLRVVQPDEGEDETTAQAGFTVGDAAHSIAELAEDIRKRFRGFLPADGLKAVELAITQHLANQQLALAYPAGLQMEPPTLDADALDRLAQLEAAALGEDDPSVQHEIPTQEGL